MTKPIHSHWSSPLLAGDVERVRLVSDRYVNRQDPSGAWAYQRVRRWEVMLRSGAAVLADYNPLDVERYEALERA